MMINSMKRGKMTKILETDWHPGTGDQEALAAVRAARRIMDANGIMPEDFFSSMSSSSSFADMNYPDLQYQIINLESALEEKQRECDELAQKNVQNAEDDDQISLPPQASIDEIVTCLREVDHYSASTDEIGHKRTYRSLSVVYSITRIWDDLDDPERKEIIEKSGQASVIKRLKTVDAPSTVGYMAWPGKIDPRKRNRTYWINAMRAALLEDIDAADFTQWVEDRGGIKKAAEGGKIDGNRNGGRQSAGEPSSLDRVMAARAVGKRLAKAKVEELDALYSELSAVLTQ